MNAPMTIQHTGPLEIVEAALKDAGKTLMSLPEPKEAHLDAYRPSWPEPMQDFWELMNSMTDEERRRFASDRHGVRLVAGARQIDRLDETLSWLMWLDAPMRRLVFGRMLIWPASGRHVYSWRQLAKTLGTNHETARAWWERGVSIIAQEYCRRGVDKSARRMA